MKVVSRTREVLRPTAEELFSLPAVPVSNDLTSPMPVTA